MTVRGTEDRQDSLILQLSLSRVCLIITKQAGLEVASVLIDCFLILLSLY